MANYDDERTVVVDATPRAASSASKTPASQAGKSAAAKAKKPSGGTKRGTAKKRKIGIVYNAPVTLTFSLICVAVLLFHRFGVAQGKTLLLFVAPGAQWGDLAFDYTNPTHYLRLFLHVFGHSDWSHLIPNLTFLLLFGPILEERFGSRLLLLMITITAFVTGIINACFIPFGLMGASGIVFMMIILSSFCTIDRTKIPLTFILVCLLCFGQELAGFAASRDAGISTVAHVAGGVCGSLFGFLATPKKRRAKKARQEGRGCSRS